MYLFFLLVLVRNQQQQLVQAKPESFPVSSFWSGDALSYTQGVRLHTCGNLFIVMWIVLQQMMAIMVFFLFG